MLWRNTDFDKTSGYNVNMRRGLEDWDYWLTLLSPDDDVHQLEEILFNYRIRNNSRNKTAVSYLNSLYSQIVENHYDKYSGYVSGTHLMEVYNRLFDAESEILALRKSLSSHAYRIGKIVIKPFSLLRSLVSRFCAKRMFSRIVDNKVIH